jgi:CHAD domain-containing protein
VSSPLLPLSQTIDKHHRVLLDHYEVEDLHQLRVNIRRLRVFLAHFDNEEAQGLRREWGRVMRFTNDARDWDTFMGFAQGALPAEHFETLHPVLVQHQEAAQAQALQAVRSKDWEKHSARWHAFLEQAPDFSDEDFEVAIAAARQRIGMAWTRASDRDDRKSWHRLRIAIKGMRYLLDTHPDAERDHLGLIALCKDIQTDLGNWHDTVVHGKLLKELIDSGGLGDTALHAAEQLAAAQARTGSQCLARVHETMGHFDLAQAR